MGGTEAGFSRLSFMTEPPLVPDSKLAGTVSQAPIQTTSTTNAQSSFSSSAGSRVQTGPPAPREVLGEGSPAPSGSFTWLGEWHFLHTSTNISG